MDLNHDLLQGYFQYLFILQSKQVDSGYIPQYLIKVVLTILDSQLQKWNYSLEALNLQGKE